MKDSYSHSDKSIKVSRADKTGAFFHVVDDMKKLIRENREIEERYNKKYGNESIPERK